MHDKTLVLWGQEEFGMVACMAAWLHGAWPVWLSVWLTNHGLLSKVDQVHQTR